jgi:hypothetical protein
MKNTLKKHNVLDLNLLFILCSKIKEFVCLDILLNSVFESVVTIVF